MNSEEICVLQCMWNLSFLWQVRMRDDAEHSNRRRREGCIQSTNVIHFVITKKGGKKVLLKLAGHGFFSHKLQNVDSWYFKFYVLDVDDFLQTFIQQSFVCDQPILNKNGLKCLYISEKIHYRRTNKCKRCGAGDRFEPCPEHNWEYIKYWTNYSDLISLGFFGWYWSDS